MWNFEPGDIPHTCNLSLSLRVLSVILPRSLILPGSSWWSLSELNFLQRKGIFRERWQPRRRKKRKRERKEDRGKTLNLLSGSLNSWVKYRDEQPITRRFVSRCLMSFTVLVALKFQNTYEISKAFPLFACSVIYKPWLTYYYAYQFVHENEHDLKDWRGLPAMNFPFTSVWTQWFILMFRAPIFLNFSSMGVESK